MKSQKWNRSLQIAMLVAALISVVSLWAEWNSAQQVALRFSVLALALVLAAAVGSYVLRILRFYLLLSGGGVPVTLSSAALAQGVGFALSITPGSIGDLFRLQFIRERAGTSLWRVAPAVLLDRTLEGAGFLVLILLAGLALPALHTPLPYALLLAVLALVCIGLIARGKRGKTAVRKLSALISRWPRLGRVVTQAEGTVNDLRSTATPRRLAMGFLLTALARLADGLVLLFAAEMMGVPLALPVAIFVVAAGGFAGGLSLLPGGTGATEAAMAGLLMTLGATFAAALAIALLARFFTLWLWVGLGLGEALTFQLAPATQAVERT